MHDTCLTIKYPHGTMNIFMEEFFPTTSGNIRKLYKKVIGLIRDQGEQDRITKEILEYLEFELKEAEDEEVLRSYANASVSAHTKATEIQEYIDRQQDKVDRLKEHIAALPYREKRMYADTMKAEKEKLKVAERKQKSYMHDFRYHKKEFERRKSIVEKLKANIETIRDIGG